MCFGTVSFWSFIASMGMFFIGGALLEMAIEAMKRFASWNVIRLITGYPIWLMKK